jgi:riboflavin synthase
MFTGIITHLATLLEIKMAENKDAVIVLQINNPSNNLQIGCSIACNGICLTLIAKESNQSNQYKLTFQLSEETCDKTNVKNWKLGDVINIEFAIRAGDEFGGHFVTGHIDGLAEIANIENVQQSWKVCFIVAKNIMKYIAKKGSVAINGVSLTVNEVDNDRFFVNIIPHTIQNTNFNFVKIGDLCNLEVDLISRYLVK